MSEPTEAQRQRARQLLISIGRKGGSLDQAGIIETVAQALATAERAARLDEAKISHKNSFIHEPGILATKGCVHCQRIAELEKP